MKKEALIYLKGDFNSHLVRTFKQKLRENTSGILRIRINSYGGNLHAMNTISAFLYYLIKYKKRSIIIEIETAESAALMLAVNFPIRYVLSTSTGSIHLPVLAKGKYVSESVLENKRKKAINFFVSKTTLKEEEVIALDGVMISAKQMVEMGIATKMVEKFSP